MSEASQENASALAYLKKRLDRSPALLNEIPSISIHSGKSLFTHHEVLERIWGQLGTPLPRDCRAIVHGTPVLQHPDTGLIFVIGMGTFYWLRIPVEMLIELQANEHNFVQKMWNGEVIDVRRELGVGWAYGGWREAELEWCIEFYKQANENKELGVRNV
ncbi:MAG: hypothetical protein ABSF70_09195 [Terracidiphilus sp.]|jgi:hypothetical protein